MTLKPLFARVLLRREKLTKVGSIIIPEKMQKTHACTRGVVEAIGDGVDPETVKVGHTYIFGRYAGAWIGEDMKPSDDESSAAYYVLKDEDLIAEVCDE